MLKLFCFTDTITPKPPASALPYPKAKKTTQSALFFHLPLIVNC